MDILSAISFAIWGCMKAAKFTSLKYSKLFTSENVLEELLLAASLKFCPGLLAAMTAETPPTLDFFKNLPSEAIRAWGVYVLVLEKKGFTPLVYVGSATNMENGIETRWCQYDRNHAVSERIRTVRSEGFRITRKVRVAWGPHPTTASEIAPRRHIYLALEAAFTFLFWTIASDTPHEEMEVCCPWLPSMMSYEGLNSHSPFRDYAGPLDLSPAQLEALNDEVRWNRNLYCKEWRTKNPEKWRRIYEKRNAIKYDVPGALERQMAINRALAKSNKISHRFYCPTCKFAAGNASDLLRHQNGKPHILRSRQTPPTTQQKYMWKAKDSKRFCCKVCDLAVSSGRNLEQHLRSQRHLDKAAKKAMKG